MIGLSQAMATPRARWYWIACVAFLALGGWRLVVSQATRHSASREHSDWLFGQSLAAWVAAAMAGRLALWIVDGAEQRRPWTILGLFTAIAVSVSIFAVPHLMDYGGYER